MLAALARATHPEPAAAVTVTAALLALAVGHPPGSAALVAATVATSQLAVGWTNDAVDATRDTAVGRTDKPIVTGAVTRRVVAVAAVAAAAGTVALTLVLWPPAAAAVAVTGLVSALAYNWPLKRTAVSVLPYAVSFAALPSFVVLALPATPPVWLPVAGGLLGAGAHFANVLPDLADDAATGVRGLPHRLGPARSTVTAGGLLLASAAVLAWAPPGSPSRWQVAALAGAAVVLPAGWFAARSARARGRRPTALFRAFLIAAVLTVALLFGGGALL
jgi:heme o synthase